ncbi:MAG: hypothetical protein ACREEM_41435 [Blastocatellia bacterium]
MESPPENRFNLLFGELYFRLRANGELLFGVTTPAPLRVKGSEILIHDNIIVIQLRDTASAWGAISHFQPLPDIELLFDSANKAA